MFNIRYNLYLLILPLAFAWHVQLSGMFAAWYLVLEVMVKIMASGLLQSNVRYAEIVVFFFFSVGSILSVVLMTVVKDIEDLDMKVNQYLVLSCFVLFCFVLSCLVLLCLVLPYLVLPCLVLPCLVLPCLVLTCLVFSCLTLSCLDLSCLCLVFSWPCLVLPCLALP